MRHPTIHLNGTGAKTLLDGYLEAIHQLGQALNAINNIEFNARDYYPQGSSAWGVAESEMEDRKAGIMRAKLDFEDIAERIQATIDEQSKRKNA